MMTKKDKLEHKIALLLQELKIEKEKSRLNQMKGKQMDNEQVDQSGAQSVEATDTTGSIEVTPDSTPEPEELN